MAFSGLRVRRWLLRSVGAGALLIAAVPLLDVGVATAQPPPPRPPSCTAADLAGVAAGVAAATSAYLFTHPDVNEFLTGLHGRSDNEVPDAVRAYFDANPQARADLSGIRQPLTDFRGRCELPSP